MLPDTKTLLEDYGLFAKKSMGQNFLFDPLVTDRIAKNAAIKTGPLSQGVIVEIGPGPGGLTRALLENGAEKLILIEKDQRFIPLLKKVIDYHKKANVEIREEDALKTDFSLLGAGIRVVANLPYNVATPILINFLHNLTLFRGFVLMFQKEVALRITAAPDTEFYGRLSIISQFLCETEILMELPPEAFFPAPKVFSSVILLKPKENIHADIDLKKLEKTTSVLFAQRRKMLRKTLKSLGNPEKICEKAGIDGTKRPESLSVEDFCNISRMI